VLALGRAVNALHFVHTPLLNGENDTPRAIRDRLNAVLFTCALFAESIVLVEKMDTRYFGNHPAFQKLTNIVADAQPLRKQLFLARNKLVFHFDPDEVREQMTSLKLENPILVTGLGTQKLNTYHELIDIVAMRVFFGTDFPDDLTKLQPSMDLGELVITFLAAAEEFMIALVNERKWAYREMV
jgi:hypothetical protein